MFARRVVVPVLSLSAVAALLVWDRNRARATSQAVTVVRSLGGAIHGDPVHGWEVNTGARPVTDAQLEAVVGLGGIRALFVNASEVSDQGLAPLARCTTLGEFQINLGGLSTDRLAVVGGLAGLRRLTLGGRPVRGATLGPLGKLPLKSCSCLRRRSTTRPSRRSRR